MLALCEEKYSEDPYVFKDIERKSLDLHSCIYMLMWTSCTLAIKLTELFYDHFTISHATFVWSKEIFKFLIFFKKNKNIKNSHLFILVIMKYVY